MLAEVGITAAADGTLSISDTSKFNAALTSNPDGVVALFNSADGIASRVTNRLTSFLTTGGVVDTSQQAMTADITAMNSAIDEQENLLKIRQEQLTQQYTALAEVMAQLQMQQGVVTDYLNSLNSSSSTSTTG
jgi:flagellar hook-associated protein 2